MANEIELKLTLPAPDALKLQRLPLLRTLGARKVGKRRLVSIYFDTPDQMLHRHDLALRLRHVGRRWIQTLKTGGRNLGGFSERGEYEKPVSGSHLDISSIGDARLQQWLDQQGVAEKLAPVFSTEFDRMTWEICIGAGTTIELALDRGEIRAAGRQVAILEIELELLVGDATALFDIAAALAHDLDLKPEIRSKAERGYALLLGTHPRKGLAIVMESDEPSQSAICKIVSACLAHALSNEHGVVAAGYLSPEVPAPRLKPKNDRQGIVVRKVQGRYDDIRCACRRERRPEGTQEWPARGVQVQRRADQARENRESRQEEANLLCRPRPE